MIIHNIKITNFKSIYGTKEFNFDELKGLVKLSGPVGAGKTTVAEALIYGLFGDVKKQNNSSLIAWNTNDCCVEMNITSKGREIHIIRSVRQPLVVEVNGSSLAASNKRNAQSILEEELYDVSKLAVIRMCVISFNQFNSIADMNPGQTKEFLDDIFGFRLFSDYSDAISIERRNAQAELTKLNAILEENTNQIQRLHEKKAEQQAELASNTDLQKYHDDRERLVSEGKDLKSKYNEVDASYKEKEQILTKEKEGYTAKKVEYGTLGKQEKQWCNTFSTGKCPTCGNQIEAHVIEEHKAKMYEYAELFKAEAAKEQDVMSKINEVKQEHQSELNVLMSQMNDLKAKIQNIDREVAIYNNNVKLISENFDDLISEYENKLDETKNKIENTSTEILEWADMAELFSKTFRYNLLNTIIPHLNQSIAYFMEKMDQDFRVEFDQEFKAHLYSEYYEEEISYNNLSTGQKKTLDLSIIFGILQNIIANVDFNVILLDELFSNMDSDTRNLMLSILKESTGADKSVFIINHAEMGDDMFAHKIHVSRKAVKAHIEGKRKESVEVRVKASYYEQIF